VRHPAQRTVAAKVKNAAACAAQILLGRRANSLDVRGFEHEYHVGWFLKTLD
jgi:hypothetical protein